MVEPRGGAVGARAHPHVDIRRDEFARDFGPERGPTVGIPEESGRGRRGDLRAALRVHRRGRRGQVARLIAASEALDEVPEPHGLVPANPVRAGHRAPCLDPDRVVARGARRQRIIGPSFPSGLPACPLETPGEHHRPTTRDVSVEEVSGSDGAHRDASHGMGRGAPRWRLPSVVVILAAVRISQTTAAAIIGLLLEPSLAHRPDFWPARPPTPLTAKIFAPRQVVAVSVWIY